MDNRTKLSRDSSSRSLISEVDVPQCSKFKIRRCLSTSAALRTAVGCSLLASAGICGTLSYLFISELEQELGDDNYDSVSREAGDVIVESASRMIAGGRALAVNYGISYPELASWPNVVLPTFPALAQELSEISTSIRVFGPLVRPEEVDSFEAFYYEYYDSDPTFYNGIGQHSFGEGIFAFDVTLDAPDKKFHDTTGKLGSPAYNVLVPAVQYQDMTQFSAAPGIMWNLLSQPDYAKPVNYIIDCSLQAAAASQSDTGTSSFPECFSSTDLLPVIAGTAADATSDPELADAQLGLAHPVYAKNNATTLVGMTATIVSLSDLLTLAVPDYIDGIDIVFSTDTSAYTFSIENGKPKFRGDGDKHDTAFTDKGVSKDLFARYITAPNTPAIQVTIYPSSDYYESYYTDLPLYACVGSVSIILFCSILFVLYDYLMRWEYNQSQAVLETKKRYVRYISHEVRTPLNVAILGVKLIEMEVQKVQQLLMECMDAACPSKHSCDDSTDDATDATTTVLSTAAGEATDVPKSVSVLPNTTAAAAADIVERCQAMREASAVVLETTDEIKINTEYAVGVLNDLINYDKVESGTLHLECAKVPIWEITQSIVTAFRAQSQVSGVHLQLLGSAWPEKSTATTTANAAVLALADVAAAEEFCNDNSNDDNGDADGNGDNDDDGSTIAAAVRDLFVVGDTVRLSMVLQNLLSNAVKFTPIDGTVTVRAEWVPEGLPNPDLSRIDPHHRSEFLQQPYPNPRSGSVRISVVDSGAGMTSEQLNDLFLEGMQFNANNLQAGHGSGLGLFITKGTVEQHGGVISATSDGLDEGAVFTVELPLFRAAASLDACQESSEVVDEESNTGSAQQQQQQDQARQVDLPSPSPQQSKKQRHRIRFRNTASVSPVNDALNRPTVSSTAVPMINSTISTVVSESLVRSTAAAESSLHSAATTTADAAAGMGEVFEGVNPAGKDEQHLRTLSRPPSRTSSPLPALSASAAASAVGVAKPQRMILMVDDSLPNRKMLGRLLRTHGCTIVEAVDGQDAVDKMAANMAAIKAPPADSEAVRPFDSVVMDFEMPVMKGPEATKIIRKMGFTGPIVGVSGNVLKEDVDNFLSCGATAVLPKPVNIDELKGYW